jgi:hypothetical protein
MGVFMMKTYARVMDGIVAEIIPSLPFTHEDGSEYKIEERYVPEYVAQCVDITGVDPAPLAGFTYDGAMFAEPIAAQPSIEYLASVARLERDRLLRDICDPGILMAQRALRMASSPEETAYAEGKIAEMDAYAVALTNVPQQPEFPTTINWPEAPSL